MRHPIRVIFISGILLAACSDDSSDNNGQNTSNSPLENAEAVFSTGFSNCARTTDKKTYCWGYDFKGNLGDGAPSTPKSLAVEVKGLDSPLVRLDGSRVSTCGITESGAVYCWGMDKDGSLGPVEPPLTVVESDNPFLDGSYTSTPFKVFDGGYIDAEFGDSHGCAIQDSGTIDCWGTFSFFVSELTGTREVSQIVPIGWTPKSLAISSHADCALSTDGEVWCWGDGRFGALGSAFDDSDPNYVSCDALPVTEISFCTIEPQKTEDLGGTVVQLEGEGSTAAGFCARLDDGGVKCWGGNPSRFPSEKIGVFSPVSLDLPMAAVDIAMGDNHVCVLLEDDSVVCAGENQYAQLGSERADGPNLTAVQFDGKPVDIVGGYESTCAVLDTGRVQCWGLNGAMQLGVSDAGVRGSDIRFTPVTVQVKK